MNDSYDVPGPFTARLDGQGALQPGTEGWWPVHGAHAIDIRPGDLVMTMGAGDVSMVGPEVLEVLRRAGDPGLPDAGR